ncbi:MAG: hypothetical protein R2795_18390 [Saprospiraceae bacterium]
MKPAIYLLFLLVFPYWLGAQPASALAVNPLMYDIATAASPERIEADIQQLVNFGTRHTLSDTMSNTRGIGAARRWIKSTFEDISTDCGGCLAVSYHKGLALAEGNARIPQDTWIVNVMALQRGTKYPNKYVLMTGDIDSRVSDPLNGTDDSP